MNTRVTDSFSLSMRTVTLDGQPATVEAKTSGWSGVTVTDKHGRRASFTRKVAAAVLSNGGHFRTLDRSLAGVAAFGRAVVEKFAREDRVAQARTTLGL